MKNKVLLVFLVSVLVGCAVLVANAEKPNRLDTVKIDDERIVALTTEISGSASTETIQKIANFNKESRSKPIWMIVESPGGSVDAGLKVINAMKASKAKIYCMAQGEVASMAAFIYMFCDQRYSHEYAKFMFHQARANIRGATEDEMEQIIKMQKKLIEKLYMEVVAKMGIDYDVFREKIQQDWWMDAEEAQKENVVETLVEYFAWTPPMIQRPSFPIISIPAR